MDGLRPEMDELDRFKDRSATKMKTEPQKAKGKKVERARQEKSTSGFPLVLMFVLFISGVAVFSWFSWKQQVEITSLKAQLSEASGFMDQSKLLIARLEGRLSETGVELAESGTAAEKKLAFLDAEMRKLWGVAYDRNKKSIESNQESLNQLEKKISSLQEGQASEAKNVAERLNKIAKRIESNDVRLGSLDKRVVALRTDQELANTETKEYLAEQKKIVDSVRKDTQNYLERTAKLDLSIESINASRSQLNGRIVELDKKINALQLKNSALAN